MTAQTTFQAKPGGVETRWYIVDARGQTLGRLAANVARVLRGKHRPQFTRHVNTGEHVIVINARDVVVTGRKRTLKIYDRYSGYPSGRRTRSFEEALERDPTFPIVHAVRGMLQHNTLGADQLKRLRVYAGAQHRHHAQRPQAITFGELGEIIVARS
ncbi:MAG: 50S ribosomal protein L13 [Candidatus Dormibacteraeota bacterium]|nr:50S ribosomal protein L13 [Candidatus Dormibacteraeota bacterium]MBV9526300.1 50S ribosomal protein L13 [Candidatus Dormibacteraeota bacterium]